MVTATVYPEAEGIAPLALTFQFSGEARSDLHLTPLSNPATLTRRATIIRRDSTNMVKFVGGESPLMPRPVKVPLPVPDALDGAAGVELKVTGDPDHPCWIRLSARDTRLEIGGQ